MPSTFEDEQEALAYTTRDYLCECGHHVDAHAPITDISSMYCDGCQDTCPKFDDAREVA